jgi:hypothetical protein
MIFWYLCAFIWFKNIEKTLLQMTSGFLQLESTTIHIMWFQHDGAPPHYYRRVRQYLDKWRGDHWIGRGGSVAWPARSPDLTPLDFFFGVL